MTIYASLSPPWQACLEETWAAYCAGSVPVGAVVVAPDRTILARGRNHIFDDDPAGHVNRHDFAHAELNALLEFDRSRVDAHGCALYTSMEPCPLCLGAFYMSGLRELRFAARDEYAGSANLIGATDYMRRKPTRIFGPEHPGLEIILIALSVELSLRQSFRGGQDVLERWTAIIPAGVQLGRQLAESGYLADLRASRLSAEEAFEKLAAMLPG